MVNKGIASNSAADISTDQKPVIGELSKTDPAVDSETIPVGAELIVNGEKKSKSNRRNKSTSKSSSRRKKPRRRLGANGGPSGHDSDAEELKSRLLKRRAKDDRNKGSKSAKMETERGPVVRRNPTKSKGKHQTLDDDTCVYEIVNPSTYDKLFTRLEETHFNKAIKPDGVCLDNTPWICCFCQRKPCVDDLGDLFGPYYVKLSPPDFWPPFIDRQQHGEKSNKKPNSESGVYTDLWFHGDCVYWAPGILLRGSGMTGLDEYLPKYWQQKCKKCQQAGASITCTVKGCEQSLHYPCAVEIGSILKESTYTMYCQSHKKLADKRK